MDSAPTNDSERRLAALCEATDQALWQAHAGSLLSTGEAGLRFPSQEPPQPQPLRVSEQEARHAFAALAPELGYSYTLETPTELAYIQSGKKATRARFDASLIDGSGERMWNVEFKKGGYGPASKSTEIFKDLEKLLVDPGNGAWFHMLERINNGTVGSLAARLRADVERVADLHRIDMAQVVTFHICVLEPAFSLHTSLSVDQVMNGALDLEYRVDKGRLASIDSASWIVNRPTNASPEAAPDSDRWQRNVPMLWDILDGRSRPERWPAGPPQSLDAAISWYAPISTLLVQSLGWVRPDIGLGRWYEDGRKHLDHRFEVLDRLWGPALDPYLSWAATSPAALRAWSDLQDELGGERSASHTVEWVGPAWVQRSARIQGEHGPAPIGGQDPLHLSVHLMADGGPASEPVETKTGTVLLGGPRWYADLHALGDEAAEVILRDRGSLGAFRRSTTTGRWFTGSEEHHLLGWP